MQVSRRRLARLAICMAAFLMPLIANSSTAVAEEPKFEFGKAFGPDGTSLTEFEDATSVAVDSVEKVVYVLDRRADALYKFDLEGNPVDFGGSSPNISGNKLSGFSIADGLGGRQIAVDSASHTIYVPDDDPPLEYGGTVLKAYHADGEPSEFTAGPGAGTNAIPGFESLRGIAVDPEENIYTTQFCDECGLASGGSMTVFKASGAEVMTQPLLGPDAVAVDERGIVYYLENEKTVTRLMPSEHPITSSTTFSQVEDPDMLDPNYASGVAVDPLLNRLFVAESRFSPTPRIAVFSEEWEEQGSFAGPGEKGELVNPSSVSAGGSNDDGVVIYVSDDPGGGPRQVKIFKEEICVCPPSIELEAATEITADSATLRAKINPNNLETTYWWEYGLEDCAVATCTKVPVAGADIGDGRKGVVVTQLIAGLESATVYHYRVTAENEEGVTVEATKSFTTQGPLTPFVLSDARAWEMVSPPTKFAGIPYGTGDTVIQAAEPGDGLVYASFGSIMEKPESNRLPSPATLLAKRTSDGRWSSEDLTPPHTNISALEPDTEFNIFSPDLARAEMEPTDATPLSAETTEETPYLWSDRSSPFFTPLLTSSNVPPGTEFGPEPGNISNPVRIEGADPALEHIVLRSDNVPLVEGAAPGGLYMWHSGQLEAVSQLPASDGGAVVKGIVGSGLGSVRRAVSDDGSRVFWAPVTVSEYDVIGTNVPALFVRDVEAGETGRLDVPDSDASGSGAERPAFNIASTDGSVVFFTDSQQLTADASPSGRDLYRCEIGQVEGILGCADLSDVSAPLAGSGESAEVLDQVSAASEDGSSIYFVARGILDEAPNGAGAVAVAGQPNIYLWQQRQGVRFIATLSKGDSSAWGGRPTQILGQAFTIDAAASPNGRYFAFTSEATLTSADNHDSSGTPNTEVYLFDAENPDDALSCLSCSPIGGVAVGERLPARIEFFPPDPSGLWQGRQVAATLPEAAETKSQGRSLYRPRSVLNNGRVFFNSIESLVPGDSNGTWDVYQYEPLGAGTCKSSTGSRSAARSGNGCVGLLSSGTAEGDAGFLDATPSGNDVFFLTRGRLSVLDRDNEVDVYDARVGGIVAVRSPSVECTGEGCRSGGAQPNDSTPSSESFHAPQRALHCRKGLRKVRRHGKTVCVRKKHKKHHKKRTGTDGRAQR
jgi:DNA-binding beta-propeller fold protein YncE